MAITLADFNKIWASTSPLTPYSFSESNYKQGWNFIGSTPPARQMWDFLQKQNDEKMQYIVNDICVPTEIDETPASGNYYSYSVPTGKVFANFKTLGGKTIAWNQLCDKCLSPSGTIQITASGNGVFVINGSTTNSETHQFSPTTYSVSGHKYYVAIHSSSTLANRDVIIYNNNGGIELSNTGSLIASANSDKIFILRLNDSVSFSNVTVKVKVIDLTLAFGSGNEPTTTAEVESLFPAVTYNYTEGTLLSAGIKEVIAKDSSNNVVATMPIPSAVQALEGYGWSVGDGSNYIDFENKKYVHNVFKASNPITGASNNGFTSYRFDVTGVPANAPASSFLNNWGIKKGNYNSSAMTEEVYEISTNKFNIALLNSRDINELEFLYKVSTPIETDISSILGAVGIACGNTLTFDYDDNFKLPIPVSMDLIDNTYGMMTAQDKAKLEVVYDYIQRVSGN